MMSCAYCGQKATTSVVSNPHQVCLAHAVEYWTGLLNYVTDRANPCVKRAEACGCRRCEAARRASRRGAAIAAAGPCPTNHAPFQTSVVQ